MQAHRSVHSRSFTRVLTRQRLAWLTRACVLSAALTVALGWTSQARAMSLYAGALGGYGFGTQNVDGIDPYGLALGLNAGLSLPIVPIYVGARALWYEGATKSFVSSAGRADVSRNYRMLGLDFGYEASLGPIVLRPTVSIGSASLNIDYPHTSALAFPQESTLYLSPGVALLLKLGLIYVGAEARYNVLTRHAHPDGCTLLANVGVTL